MRQTERVLPMRRPLVALACVFAIGIWSAGWIDVPVSIPWSLAGVFFLAAMFFLYKQTGGPLRFFLWLLLFWALGWSRGVLPSIPSVEAPRQIVALAGIAQTGWRKVGGGLQVVLTSNSLGRAGGVLKPWPGNVRMTVLTDHGIACPAVLPGDEIRVLAHIYPPSTRRNYGTRNTREFLQGKGIYWSAVVKDCNSLLLNRTESLSVQRLAQKARYALEKLLSQVDTGDDSARAVFAALSFGETGFVPPQTRLNFQRAGLAHLLAVSGLHLGTVAIGLYLFLSLLLCRIRLLALRMDVRRIAATLVIPAVGFYVLLVGARLPSVRASVVILCFLLAIILRRKSDSLNILAAAWLLVLGLWPVSLFDPSFQLSFAAAISVVVFAPHWAASFGVAFSLGVDKPRLLEKIGRRFVQLVLVSAAATVGTAPFVIWHFHQVSIVGLFANLLAVPLASWFIVPVGIVSAIVLTFSNALAAGVACLGVWLCQYLDWVANFFSTPVWASWNVAGLGVVSLLAWFSFWILATSKWHVHRIRFVAGMAALFVCGSLIYQTVQPGFSKELRLTAIDVGQGDCLLLRFPGGKSWLVDGGGTYSGRYDVGLGTVAPALWALGIDHLDVVVATHRDPDHVGGLPSVVSLFHPSQVWSSIPLDENEFSKALAVAAISSGAKLKLLNAGNILDDIEGVRMKVLWPPVYADGLEENERSLVLRLSYGSRSILLTGDLEKRGEEGLVNSGVRLQSDILKVGHHGSKNATSTEFLKKVKPSVAVISVGARNHFGLPHPKVLQRLTSAGVKIFRTDLDGEITIDTDGDRVQIQTWTDAGWAY